MFGNYGIAVFFRNKLRETAIKIRWLWLKKFYKMNIGEGTIISMKAQLDKTYPMGINIGKNSYVAADALVLTHDFINRIHTRTIIGDCVFIGSKSIILPGVTICDRVVVAAGAVVVDDIQESNVIVAGNPAKIIRRNETIGKHGKKYQRECRIIT